MIQNYDTNGLVFAFSPEKMKVDQDDVVYNKALENILDTQGFNCMPLIDNPRIRLNTNNMKDRAIYQDGGGSLTHIVRKPKYDDEIGLQFIPVTELNHVDSETDLVDAITTLFAYEEGKKCNFVITVGGTPSHPEAIFTLRELLLDKTLRDLFFRMAHAGFSSSNKDMAYRAYDLYENLENITKESNWDNIKKVLAGIVSYLEMIPKSEDLRNQRSSDLNIDTKFSELRVRDIMTMAACGLETAHSGGKEDIPDIKMAFNMVSEANDFSCLVAYENGVLNPKKMIVRGRKDSYKFKLHSNVLESDDLVKDVICSMNSTDEFYATILPDRNIITGEGPMVWPGFLALKNLTSPSSLLTYAAICAMIESKLKKRARNCNITVEETDTLGNIIHKVSRYKEPKKLKQFKHPNAMKIFDGKVSKDELHKLIPVRNKIIHESLMKCYSRNLGKDVSLKDVKLIYKIAEILEIN